MPHPTSSLSPNRDRAGVERAAGTLRCAVAKGGRHTAVCPLLYPARVRVSEHIYTISSPRRQALFSATPQGIFMTPAAVKSSVW